MRGGVAQDGSRWGKGDSREYLLILEMLPENRLPSLSEIDAIAQSAGNDVSKGPRSAVDYLRCIIGGRKPSEFLDLVAKREALNVWMQMEYLLTGFAKLSIDDDGVLFFFSFKKKLFGKIKEQEWA